MKRVKFAWIIDIVGEPDYVVFKLNGEINSLIPRDNLKVLNDKYVEILGTSEYSTFSCIILR